LEITQLIFQTPSSVFRVGFPLLLIGHDVTFEFQDSEVKHRKIELQTAAALLSVITNCSERL